MLKRLKKIVLSAGVGEKEYRAIKEEINNSNRGTVIIFSGVVIAILISLYMATFFVEDLGKNRIVYGGFLLPLLVLLILSYLRGKQNQKMMFGFTYFFMGTILMIGIMMGTVLGPSEVTATFIAILLIIPQMFTDRPWHMYLMIGFIVSLFIYMALKYKDPVTWTSDITNTLVFGLLSAVVCTYNICIRVSRFEMERKIRLMAEFDQLTGLKNRNSYEDSLVQISEWDAESVFCAYIDVNGLHELNNTQGHDAGDRMLKYVAKEIRKNFDANEIYRIGGDEFVILGKNREKEDIMKLILQIRDAVEAGGYYIAIGIGQEQKENIDITALIKEAEQMMYEDKREFYRKRGNDRRRSFS